MTTTAIENARRLAHQVIRDKPNLLEDSTVVALMSGLEVIADALGDLHRLADAAERTAVALERIASTMEEANS